MKKVSIKKIITLVLWIIGLSGLVTSLAFATKKQQALKTETINITIINNDDNAFIDEDDVTLFFKERKDSILNVEIKNNNVSQLEKVLNTHPAVENADVSIDINGDVKIDVIQRTPILRVFNADNESYYIDTQAKLMPLSDNYTARVIIANGYIFEPYARRHLFTAKDIEKNKFFSELSVLDELYNLADYITKDSTLSPLIHQISVTKEKEFELFPAIGSHKIMFGDGKNIAEKFNKLLIFYKEGLNKTNNWNNYSIINLKYKNQVVCTKK